MFKQPGERIHFFSTFPVELFFYKIFSCLLHHVCRKRIESGFIMDFYRKADDSVLLDLLAAHTNRLTQMMIYGETYKGEYDASKLTVELLQDEIITRRGFYFRSASYTKPFSQSSVAMHTR